MRRPYVVRKPTGKATAIVASIPHTGTVLPGAVAATLASDAMRAQPMTDWHLDALYDFLPGLGVTTIHAVYSRFVVDLNRAPKPMTLYPGRFETTLVPLETFDGVRVFAKPPDEETVESRRVRFHAPYHDRLFALLDKVRERHGRVVLFDLHSVASGGNRIHGPLHDEIYLGDRDGRSCPPAMTAAVGDAFEAAGYRVAVNDPYKGGYITQHYGSMDGVDALQIEMAQRVYMDERRPADGPDAPAFAVARRRLRDVLRTVLDALG